MYVHIWYRIKTFLYAPMAPFWALMRIEEIKSVCDFGFTNHLANYSGPKFWLIYYFGLCRSGHHSSAWWNHLVDGTEFPSCLKGLCSNEKSRFKSVTERKSGGLVTHFWIPPYQHVKADAGLLKLLKSSHQSTSLLLPTNLKNNDSMNYLMFQ